MRSKNTCKYQNKANCFFVRFGFVLFLFISFLPTLVYAQEVAVADEKAQAISSSIMSPYCPGRTLSSCPSGKAIELRKEIHQWFLEGSSMEDVQSRLSERFGDAISGKPAMSGFGAFAWCAPILFFVGLLGVVFWRLKILKSSGDPVVGAVRELSEEEQGAIDKELEERLLR